MTETDVKSRARRRELKWAPALAALFAGGAPSAMAGSIDTGNEEVELRVDLTARYNLGRRVQRQDPAILLNQNADDGDRNFGRHSTVNNRVDLLSEMDFVYRKRFGARMSAAGWYDRAYSSGFDNSSIGTSNHLENGMPAMGLSPYAKRYYAGPSGELLDAFVFGTFDLGGVPVSMRAGRHVVTWGEALLGGGATHGVGYAQSPLDGAKALSSPGIEAKELYRPLTQLSASVQATPELSFAAQYFLKWEASRGSEAGTYLGSSDALQFGGESLIVDGGTRVLRGRDISARDRGDWGVAARWSPRWLDGTLGLYVRNFSDRLPQVILDKGANEYLLAYASNIKLYGLSLSKDIGGASVGFDLNYRRNMPLSSDAATVASSADYPRPGQVLGSRGNTWHAVLNAMGSTGPTPLYDSLGWSTELTWNRWASVTQGASLFKGRDGYTEIDRVDKTAVGFAINLTPTWYQVLPGANLSMPLSYSRGLRGNSAVTGGGNRGAGSWAAGLALELSGRHSFELKYVGYFGRYVTDATGAASVANGGTALLKDRGAVFFTFKTSL